MSYQRKIAKLILPITISLSLIACGGGSAEFGGKSTSDTETDTDVTSIQLSSDSTINSDGLEPLILSATAKAGSTAVEDAVIEFNVYSNSAATVIDDSATISNSSGTGSVVTSELISGSPMNRRLYVRASTGDILSNIKSVDVTGTTVTIDGSDAISSGATAEYILKIKDSSNKAITSGESVEITSANNNAISGTSYTTDSKGEAIFTLTGSNLGEDIITVNTLGASITKVVTVSGDEFTLSAANEEININTDETINLLWKKANVMQSGNITLSATRGTLSQTIVPMTNGVASFTINSDKAGTTVIKATNPDNLSTTIVREFVATTPAYLNTQAQSSSVVPNGSTEIIATVTDADGNPVKNQTIDFSLSDTVNGSLSSSTAVTDSLGRASISYTAGNSTSAKDGVVITTFVQGHTSVATETVYLTVGGDALNISLGKDHLVGTEDVYYTKQIGVIVADSAGNGVKDQEVTFTITPTHYYKGEMYVVDTDGDGEGDEWQQGGAIVGGVTQPVVKCDSEDRNGNGSLDTLGTTEDTNLNGLLEPTKDATITVSSSGVTDETGAMVVTIKYLKSRALWSRQLITASIRGVGTEFKQDLIFDLPILAADVANAETDVPNRISPYGSANACTDPN